MTQGTSYPTAKERGRRGHEACGLAASLEIAGRTNGMDVREADHAALAAAAAAGQVAATPGV